MQTSMTYPAPAAAPSAGQCPPHAWITVGNLTSCSRCGTIDWSAALNAGRTEETPMTETPMTEIAGTPVAVTRYEVIIPTTTGRAVLPLNQPPGNLLRIRYFVTEFDDSPRRFRWLREPDNAAA